MLCSIFERAAQVTIRIFVWDVIMLREVRFIYQSNRDFQFRTDTWTLAPFPRIGTSLDMVHIISSDTIQSLEEVSDIHFTSRTLSTKWGYRNEFTGLLCDHNSNYINVNQYRLDFLAFQDEVVEVGN